jgi:hypothetical protein
MAEEKRTPLAKFNTPEGTASYPHLTKPDTKFNDEGEYKCDVILTADEAAELVEYLEGIRDAYIPSVKKKKGVRQLVAPVFVNELDDADEPTGNVIIRTKLKASGTRKDGETWSESPNLFDSDGNPMAAGIDVWSGSRVIVAGTVKPYDMTVDSINAKGAPCKISKIGVSLACRGVQVIELVSAGEKTAASYGFAPVEGGYKTAAAEAGLGVDPESQNNVDDDGNDPDEF